MKRTFFLFIAAVFFLSIGLPAIAQKFLPKSIQFKGDPEYSDQELMAAAGLKKGVVLNVDEMKSHSKLLMDTGVFDTLSFTFNGEDLVYKLAPSPTLFPIRLENLPLTPDKELDAKLHDRFPLYHGKVPGEGTLLENVRGALEEMLASQGIKATVTAMPLGALGTKNITAMNFAIQSPPVRVGTIQLDGISPEMQAGIKSVAQKEIGKPFDTENTEENLERIFELFYTDDEYVAAKVHVERSGNPIAGNNAIDIPFHVTVEEGRHYKLGSIHLPTGELLTLEMINKTAGLVTNKVETSLSVKGGVTLRRALLYVAGEYESKGYMDCVVTPHPQVDEAAGVVHYTLEVQPGPVYTMGRLTIQNTAEDLRAAMLAAWKLPAGAVFNRSALDDYFYKQGNTPLGRTFASANCRYKLTKDADTHTVDVTLRLEKKN